eukprot:CAMPEP_0201519590 /NCGR_PEP_ID=MMETSP0161_2-20130828/10102_1 /ASSEMBLY_ACC=CAM_ASM_000251 /TAXON_ID=180227 /ORGANISM="Neoparamoeba aestuarina, Strain SoJaBio B1-5/56/2" /LENGTH=504 /DNA_ID=CAMNT_0047917675 /DNA_START=608 /DNA_END=2119 /DNA_ORIENTATION=-
MMNKSPEDVLAAFDAMGPNPSNDDIELFLNDNFYPAGYDVETFVPPDYDPSPPKLAQISDNNLQTWAYSLNELWTSLGIQMKDIVYRHPERSSLIPMKNGFVSPSGGAQGRFREMYYWDSYWTIEGLLKCNMKDTAKGMILNFFELITRLGFVPNGSRDYYSKRSQPPLLPNMVRSYFEATQDVGFLSIALPYLEKEYDFWMTKRCHTFEDGTKLNFYRADSNVPRPEGYKEDTAAAENVPPSLDSELYRNFASGAETGWDFSSRWLIDNRLSSIHTDRLIPSDLNAILLTNEALLSMYSCILGNSSAASEYGEKARERWVAINERLWGEELGSWSDLDLSTGTVRREGIYPSDFLPLWFPSLSPTQYPSHCVGTLNFIMEGGVEREEEGGVKKDYSAHVETALNSLNSSGLLDYIGGVPTSLNARGVLQEEDKREPREGQQWDFPNSWAPLQMFLISSMRRQSVTSSHLLLPVPPSSSDRPVLYHNKIDELWEEQAFSLAQKW